MRFAIRSLLLAAVISGCQSKPGGGGLAVRVEVEDALVATCVELEMTDATGPVKSQLARVAGKKTYLIGITQGARPSAVVLKARALTGAKGCTAPLTTVFEGPDSPQTFVAGEVKTVTLPLVCSPLVEVCGDEFEPNDATAKVLTAGTYAARICAGDVDRFQIEVPAGKTLRAVATFVHAEGDLDVKLFDAGNVLVETSDGTTNEETVASTGSGRFVVQIFGYGQAANAYSLALTLR